MSRLPALGSTRDVERRIKRFYNHWERQVESIPTKVALALHDVDVGVEHLSQELAQYYNTPKVFNVSGFIARGLYSEAGVTVDPRPHPESDNFAPSVLRSHEAPSAIVRCVPAQPQPLYAQMVSNLPWLAAERMQLRPEWWQPGLPVPRLQPKFFCLPRCITFHSTWGKTDPSSDSLSMQTWMSDNEVAFTLDSEDGSGTYDRWEQLSGTPGLVDERKQGSPNSPLLTPFRLRIMRDNEILHTHVVVFRIVQSDEGYVRPWRNTDPAVPPLLTPAPPRVILQPPHDFGPVQPRFEDYGSRERGGAYLGYHSLHPHPPPHSLSHRQRYIYQQGEANERSRRL